MTVTTPTPPGDNSGSNQGSNDRPRYRAGQVIAYRVADTITGDQLQGHALVLKVNGDTADLALLGVGHIQTHVDNLAPAKADDVVNPLPAPEPAAEG